MAYFVVVHPNGRQYGVQVDTDLDARPFFMAWLEQQEEEYSFSIEVDGLDWKLRYSGTEVIARIEVN